MNKFQEIFDAQKLYFASNVTRSHAWRFEHLDRMAKMIKENETALQQAIARDFKTASQEYISSKPLPRIPRPPIRRANFSRG